MTTITLGELRDRLKGYSDDTEVTFGSTIAGDPLIFYRVKRRGEKLVQIELNEDFNGSERRITGPSSSTE